MKKLISLTLIVVMLLSVLVVSVNAAGNTANYISDEDGTFEKFTTWMMSSNLYATAPTVFEGSFNGQTFTNNDNVKNFTSVTTAIRCNSNMLVVGIAVTDADKAIVAGDAVTLEITWADGTKDVATLDITTDTKTYTAGEGWAESADTAAQINGTRYYNALFRFNLKPTNRLHNNTAFTYKATIVNYKDATEKECYVHGSAPFVCNIPSANDIPDQGFGTGTQADPYIVKTVSDLELVRQRVNTTQPDAYIKLDADLDLGGAEWVPFGFKDHNFTGHFDGQNHTISNFKQTVSVSGLFMGFFAEVGEGATVSNLNISQFSIVVTEGISAGVGNAGAIAGCNRGTISNCTVDQFTCQTNGSTHGEAIGGIAGTGNGRITECTVKNSELELLGGKFQIGGICAGEEMIIDNCLVKDTILTSNAGGTIAANRIGYVGANENLGEGNNMIDCRYENVMLDGELGNGVINPSTVDTTTGSGDTSVSASTSDTGSGDTTPPPSTNPTPGTPGDSAQTSDAFWIVAVALVVALGCALITVKKKYSAN